MMLTQQETNKMKDRDEQHTQDLREWRADIAKRKQVCKLFAILVADSSNQTGAFVLFVGVLS